MAGNRITIDLPQVSMNVGGTSTVVCPIGRTYHSFLINATNCTLAEITEIRVVANGKTIERFTSGTELDEINQIDGIASVGAGDFSNPLFLNLDRKSLRTRDAEEVTALGTGNPEDPQPISTLQLEIDTDSGATGANFTIQAEQSSAQNSGLVKLVRQFTYNANSAGIFEISDLPKGDLISRIWFKSASIDNVEVERDQFTVFDRSTAVNNFRLALDGFRTAPASGFLIEFGGESGFGAGPLATAGVQDLRFKLEMSGASSIPVVVEYLGPIGR